MCLLHRIHFSDLIKLTAMFVARNGRQFMTNLINREMKNYQFDFLKPQHSNFPYFTKLVEQYTKVGARGLFLWGNKHLCFLVRVLPTLFLQVMIPSKTIVDDLRTDMGNRKKLLAEVDYRVRWERQQKNLKVSVSFKCRVCEN